MQLASKQIFIPLHSYFRIISVLWKNTDVNITWSKQVTAINSELLNKSSEKYQPYYIFIIGFIIVMGYIEFVTCVLFLEFAYSFIYFPASLMLRIKAFKMNECWECVYL